jgi:hypothetical protein
MKRKHEILLALASIAVCATLHGWFLASCTGVIDSGDGVNHFQIAHFSWKHPNLFLDVWGKPLFTLLASPFAQGGIEGVMLMNVLLAACMAAFSWLTARALKLPLPWLAIPLSMLHPELFRNVHSAHTETLFAALLIASIYLLVTKRFAFAALLLGLLPYSRPEAWIVMPLFVLVILLRGKWKFLPLLLAGSIIYALVGMLAGKSPLWFFIGNPYTPENDIYGSGPWYHFIQHHKKTWGKLLTAGTALGLLSIPFWVLMRKWRERVPFLLEEVLLVAGCLVGIIAAHSAMWAIGSFGSAGYLRVITCTAPCSALLTLRAVAMAEPLVGRLKVRLQWVAGGLVTVAFTFLMWRAADQSVYYPIRSAPAEQALEEFIPQVQPMVATAPRIIYQHPYIAYLLQMDPFDEQRSVLMWGMDPEAPAIYEPAGTLILWDSKFGPVEGKMPLERLLNAPHLEMVKHHVPSREVKYGDVLFEFYAFRKK